MNMIYKSDEQADLEKLLYDTAALLRSLDCFYKAFVDDSAVYNPEYTITLDTMNRFGHCIMEQIEAMEAKLMYT
ncbi:MAG: hypothetical protein IJZ90_04040 [Clostridia bacterium]|nr:hypothetical protein [Clostridia bacterium]